jgi:hypothetical protein
MLSCYNVHFVLTFGIHLHDWSYQITQCELKDNNEWALSLLHHTTKKQRWYYEKMWGHFHFYTIQQRNKDGIIRRCRGNFPFYTAQQRNKDGIMRRYGVLGKKSPSFMEGLHYLPLLKMQKLVKVIWAENVNTYTLCLHMPM